MRRAPLTFLPVLFTSIALAGCGGTDGGRDTVPGKAEGPSRVSLAAVTDGRVGDAVTGTDAGSSVRELSRGGRPDPSEPRRRTGRRDGVGAGAACADPELLPGADTLGRLEAVTLCLLNGERADHGLAPLATDGQLARAAERHASDMVAKSYFAHEGQDGSTVRDRIGDTGYIPTSGRWVVGENLAWGTGALATPKSIVNAWMNSPGHRANVLHPDYREIGFGIVLGNPRVTNGLGATYATTFGVVGERDAAAPSAPAVPSGRSGTPGSGTLGSGSGSAPSSRRAAAVKRSAARKAKKARRAKRSKASRARAAKRARAKRAAARS